MWRSWLATEPVNTNPGDCNRGEPQRRKVAQGGATRKTCNLEKRCGTLTTRRASFAQRAISEQES